MNTHNIILYYRSMYGGRVEIPHFITSNILTTWRIEENPHKNTIVHIIIHVTLLLYKFVL